MVGFVTSVVIGFSSFTLPCSGIVPSLASISVKCVLMFLQVFFVHRTNSTIYNANFRDGRDVKAVSFPNVLMFMMAVSIAVRAVITFNQIIAANINYLRVFCFCLMLEKIAMFFHSLDFASVVYERDRSFSSVYNPPEGRLLALMALLYVIFSSLAVFFNITLCGFASALIDVLM